MVSSHPIAPLLPAGTESLEPFVAAGLLDEAAVHVAGAVARSVPETDDDVLLATALCVRALQLGHVCIAIDLVADTVHADSHAGDTSDPTPPVETLPWPEPGAWVGRLRSSDAVTERDPSTGEAVSEAVDDLLRPLVFDGSRVYLERYWRYERQVGDHLSERVTADSPEDGAAVDTVLDRFFPGDGPSGPDLQREAARVALTRRLTVLAGGPGTGKTHTLARVLAASFQLAIDVDQPLEVALAAPTGKAAARMTEAVHETVEHASMPPRLAELMLAHEALTIHRLLGYHDGLMFRHDRDNPLPHDVVVIDETSMVALPLMARLLDALRPDARLVLVGDPYQLASVEAGAVLGDIVGPAAATDAANGPLSDQVVVLERVHRFSADSAIADLADAIRVGDGSLAIEILRDDHRGEANWIDPNDRAAVRALRDLVATSAADVAEAAQTGEAELALARAGDLKVLCGTRFGSLGSFAWRDHLEHRLSELVADVDVRRSFYIGRPVIVTRNDYITGVFNGDTGIVVSDDERPMVALPGPDGTRLVPPAQIDALETWWAMTIHKSQGSEFAHAVVSLPHAPSRVLTRELLYTAVTRGKEQVTVVADEAAIRRAIDNPVARASGLGARLWPDRR